MFSKRRKSPYATIVINGDVYVKDPDKDYLFVSIYRNTYRQRIVRVEWHEKWCEWAVSLIGDRFLHLKDIRIVQCEDNLIETYLTDKQSEALGNVIAACLEHVINS